MKRPELCDQCGQPLNDRGYSVSHEDGHPGTMDIHCGIDRMWERHFCGRLCLLAELNGIIDRLPSEAEERRAAA